MWPYYLLILLPILFSIQFNRESRRIILNSPATTLSQKYCKRSIILFFILLFVLLALRSQTIGRDLNNYEYIFNSNRLSDWNKLFLQIEPAFFAFNKIIASFTENYQWYLAVVAAICVAPVAYVYVKESENAALTISLYITMSTFVMLFSGLRQSIAIALGMIAYLFVKERRPIPYLLTVSLAFLFHRSAFILLLMYPVYHLKIKNRMLWILIPSLIAVFIFNKPVFSFLTSFVSDYYDGSVSETGAYTMLILFVVLLIYSFIIPSEEEMDETTIGLRNFLILSVILQMFAPLHSLAMRMNYYYIIFIPLLIPKVINRSSLKFRQLAYVSKYVMIIFFIAYFVLTDYSDGGALDTFPYRFFWETV